MRKKIGIGLAGFGVVGRGIYEVLAENSPLIAARAGAARPRAWLPCAAFVLPGCGAGIFCIQFPPLGIVSVAG